MNENPYNAPQADLTPTDWHLRCRRFTAYASDRVGLWACGAFLFLPFTYLAYEVHWLAVVVAIVLFVALIAAYEMVVWMAATNHDRESDGP